MQSWVDQLPHNLRYIWRMAHQAGEKVAQMQKLYYDKNRDKTMRIAIDDHVWLYHPSAERTEGKLSTRYSSPFLVKEVLANGTALIRLCSDVDAEPLKVNQERLSKCHPAIPT